MPRTSPSQGVRGPVGGRGFSLVELLVVIAVIVVIVSLLLVAISAARASGDRAGLVSALRQMAMAHAAYATDNRQQLLPGYLNEDLQHELNIRVHLPDGAEVPEEAAGTYVWRLAPYINNSWQTFHRKASPGRMATLTAQYEQQDLEEIAKRPSFGLNSIYVGGDSNSGGSITERSPWNPVGNPAVAVTRMSAIRSPATLVLFAPTVHYVGHTPDPTEGGWHELRAPYLYERQWELASTGIVPSLGLAGTDAGLPALEGGDRTLPVAFADGSATVESIELLSSDMRRWASQADGPEWHP